jgi:hypothetical protein
VCRESGNEQSRQRVHEPTLHRYYQDSEGNWKIQNNKRSAFEGMGQSSMANREFSGKAYQPGNVTKKSWWGDTTHKRPAYAGNTSADHLATPAAGTDKSAHESGSSSLFSKKSVTKPSVASQTARENANTAREGGTSRYQNDRSALESSPIVDWQAQRAMDVQATKSLLKK